MTLFENIKSKVKIFILINFYTFYLQIILKHQNVLFRKQQGKNIRMFPAQKKIYRFIFILCIWSFLLIGLIKINNDNIDFSSSITNSQEYLKKIPLNGRALLQKAKWNSINLEQTSTTTASDRLMSFIQADVEILVDNKTGKLIKHFITDNEISYRHIYIVQYSGRR